MGKAFIMVGLSGAGKTTAAHKVASVVCEADHYMVNEAGQYSFDSSRLGECHAKCFHAYVSALQKGVETVAVANTNLSTEEIAPYLLAAQAYGYEPEIWLLHMDPKRAESRNLHGVPMETILKQERHLQMLPRLMPAHWGPFVHDIYESARKKIS